MILKMQELNNVCESKSSQVTVKSYSEMIKAIIGKSCLNEPRAPQNDD